MFGVQCKMARAALGLGVRELAAKAGVSPDTVFRLEKGEALLPRTVDAIRQGARSGRRRLHQRFRAWGEAGEAGQGAEG